MAKKLIFKAFCSLPVVDIQTVEKLRKLVLAGDAKLETDMLTGHAIITYSDKCKSKRGKHVCSTIRLNPDDHRDSEEN